MTRVPVPVVFAKGSSSPGVLVSTPCVRKSPPGYGATD